MKKKPLVSVIFTVYNEEKYIPEALDSMLAQSYPALEIIAVNNGSQDNTKKVLEKYNKIIVLKHLDQNTGPGGGRNIGAKIAKGEIVVFVDGDMAFDKKYIEHLVEPIVKGEEVGTSHGQELVKNIDNIWARCFSINRIPSHEKYGGVFRAIKKEAFLKAGGFNPKKGYFDDDLKDVGKSLFVDEAKCYHNNPDNLGEVFSHSKWVGSSFAKNKKTLFNYIKPYRFFLALALILVVFIEVLGIYYFGPMKGIGILFLAGVIGLLLFFYLLTFRRYQKEGHLDYFIFMPILLTVKFSGYFVGFLGGLTRKNG